MRKLKYILLCISFIIDNSQYFTSNESYHVDVEILRIYS